MAGSLTIGPLTGPVSYSDGSSGTVTFPKQTVQTTGGGNGGGGGPSPDGIPLPAGYTEADLIWRETFSRLDEYKWNTWMGDKQWGRWGNKGALALPMSAMNAGENMEEFYHPDQLQFGPDGIVITAKRDTSQNGYTWKSGCLCTTGKWMTPANKKTLSRWVVHCPDMRTGAWPAHWTLPETQPGVEVDWFEGGFDKAGVPPNNNLSTTIQPNNPSIMINCGHDLSSGFFTYDHEYVPGRTVTTWLDGVEKIKIDRNVPSCQVQYILNLQIASARTAGWHTVVTNSTPNPSILRVKSLQVYARAL